MAKKINELDYLTVSARVHVLETRLLTRERMERMLDARTMEETLRVLSECGYPELRALTASGVEAALSGARRALRDDLRGMAPDPALVDIFFLPNDYHNAKAVLKARAMGISADKLLNDAGRYEADKLREDILQDYTKNQSPRFTAAVAAAWEVLTRQSDPQAADMILDAACFEEMFAYAREAGSAFMEGYVKLLADCVNLRTLVRCRRMGRDDEFLRRALIPGGNLGFDRFLSAGCGCGDFTGLTGPGRFGEAVAAGEAALRGGALTAFERLCDNVLMDYLRTAKGLSFGERPLMGYLYARLAELVNLRVILTGRLSGLSAETIRERLRECYA